MNTSKTRATAECYRYQTNSRPFVRTPVTFFTAFT
jgi:hypothetical protein